MSEEKLSPLEERAAMRRGRLGAFVFLAIGIGVATYLGRRGPQEQHVHVILGGTAPEVTALSLQYVGTGGDVANETRFTYAAGSAPRIVNHDPKLPGGDYDLKVDVGTPDGGRSMQRRVTLKGGSTQVDLSRE